MAGLIAWGRRFVNAAFFRWVNGLCGLFLGYLGFSLLWSTLHGLRLWTGPKPLIPSVFVPEGEALLTLLSGNLEHVINHKYQLFSYLRMLGVPLGTRDLYVFRGR
jgi:hypothetical protein